MMPAWPGRAVTSLEDAVIGARLLWRLPSFFKRAVSPEHARAALAGWLARREPDFLALVKRSVFEDPRSPYLALFDWASCQYGDVERLVRQEGVEGTLRVLFRSGIYLTSDELKGRQPVVRGSLGFVVNPDRLRNPAVP